MQGEVIWNSNNNQILGIAMSSDDLPSLHDVYLLIDEEEKIKETHYMLQFVWRDLSLKFDIIGPYYSSAQASLLCKTLYFSLKHTHSMS